MATYLGVDIAKAQFDVALALEVKPACRHALPLPRCLWEPSLRQFFQHTSRLGWSSSSLEEYTGKEGLVRTRDFEGLLTFDTRDEAGEYVDSHRNAYPHRIIQISYHIGEPPATKSTRLWSGLPETPVPLG